MYAASVFTIALLLVVVPNVESQASTATCTRTHMGSNFRFFVMQTIANTNEDSIYITNSDTSGGTFVSIDSNSNEPNIDTTIFLEDHVTIPIDNRIRLTGGIIENKGLSVTVLQGFDVGTIILSKAAGACESFLALPTEALGTDYYAVTYWPVTAQALLAVGATQDGTVIEIEFLEDRGVEIFYNGAQYFGGDILRETLNEGQTLQLGTSADLTGTHITSTDPNKPIVVMCGNQFDRITGNDDDPTASRSNLVSQLPPTEQWGTLFYAVYIKDRPLNQIKLVARNAGTNIRIMGDGIDSSFESVVAGDFETYDISSSIGMVTVTADKPILVVQFGSSQSSNPNIGTDPLMVLLPPKDRYLPSYVFETFNEAASSTYALLVAQVADTGSIRLNGLPLNNPDWQQMTQAPGEVLMFGATVLLPRGRNAITNLNGNGFGAVIYGSENQCTFAFPAGMCTGDIIEPTTTTTTTTTTIPPPACTNPLYLPYPGHSGCVPESPFFIRRSDDFWNNIVLNQFKAKRAQVSPTARNMQYMTWDNDLAYVAQTWASSCARISDLPSARIIPNKFPQVGQNSYRGTRNENWFDAIASWSAEANDFNYGAENQKSGVVVSNYTQMVWATTYKVGCSDAQCMDENDNEYTLFFCNFAPAGNVENQVDPTALYTPYVSGQTCGDCPNSCNQGACDCSDKVCFNDGTISPTCECTCKLPYHDPFDCSLRCDLATEENPGLCAIIDLDNCALSSDFRDACPFKCEICPSPTPATTTSTSTTTTTTTLPPLPDCGCAAVQVTGTLFDFPDKLPGIYKIFNCQENGRPIYVSDDGRHFVYWDNLLAEWVIMRDGLGTGAVIFRNFAPIAQEPFDVTNVWDLVIEEDGSRNFQATPEVSVTCMCNQAVCESYRFDTQTDLLPAEFGYVGDFNGRPWYQMVYLNQNLNLYFHRNTNQGCSYWKVGDFDTNDGILMAYDVAVNPYAIKAPWMLGNGATFSTIDDYTNGLPNVVTKFTCTRFRV